jgi:hypothetical protein
LQDNIGSLRRSEEESRQKIRSLKANIQRLTGQKVELENEAQVDPTPYIAQKVHPALPLFFFELIVL